MKSSASIGLTPIAIAASLLLAALPGRADSTFVVGGTTSGSFVHGNGMMTEQVENDVRFKAGGLLAFQLRRPGQDLQVGLFAGALVAARASNYRLPVASLDFQHAVRVAHGVVLGSSLSGAMEPPSSLIDTETSGTLGDPALLLQPRIELEIQVGRQDQLTPILAANTYVLFRDRGQFEPGSNDLSTAVDTLIAVEWAHSLSQVHTVVARALGRVMDGSSHVTPSVSGVVGALAGYAYTREDYLYLGARAGIGRALNLDRNYLWPVEPLLLLEGALSTRRDTFRVEAAWTVRQNQYIGGYPERVIGATLSWARQASHRPLRGQVQVAYEFSTYGVQVHEPSTAAGRTLQSEKMHMARAMGKVFYSLTRGWRLLSEINLGYGRLDGAQAPATSGFQFSALLGVGYILHDRPRDEQLLTEVW